MCPIPGTIPFYTSPPEERCLTWCRCCTLLPLALNTALEKRCWSSRSMQAFPRVRSTYFVFMNKATGSHHFVTEIYTYQLLYLKGVQVFLIKRSLSVCSSNAILPCCAGERSNQCPSGFVLDPAGPYCAGIFYTQAAFYSSRIIIVLAFRRKQQFFFLHFSGN